MSVIRLATRSGRVVDRIALPAGWISSLAVGAGALWAVDRGLGVLWRVDPAGRARTIDVGQGASSIAVGGGAVWVTNSVRGTIVRVDPDTNRVAARVRIPGTPRGVTTAGGRIWVSVAGTARASPATGGLRSGARITPLPAPPCAGVLADRRGDPDVLIASELPLGQNSATLPMSDAIAFVVREHGFRAGRFTVGLQSCNDATAETGGAADEVCRQNAHLYARNPDVVGVVGPWNSSCAFQMLPVLNRAPGGPLSLVSPSNSDPELVRREPTAQNGVLAALFPRGQSGYARVYPSDDYEMAAGAILTQRLGGRVFFLEDRSYSATLGNWLWFRRAAGRIGLSIAGHAAFPAARDSYRRLTERVRSSGARTVYLNSEVPLGAAQVVRDLRAALGPDVPIVGGFRLLPVAVLWANAGAAARGMLVTKPGLTTAALGEAGRRFMRAFGATQQEGGLDPLSVYAAAATEVLLDAIARRTARGPRSRAPLPRRDSSAACSGRSSCSEPASQPISVVRVERAAGDAGGPFGTQGGVVREVITPPARLVGG